VTKGGTQGGGIQPDAQPATTVHYRFEIEQRFGAATSLRLTYNGSHGYHDILRADANTVIPAICSRAAANCPAGLMDGTKYFPAGALRPNPQLNSINQYFTSAVNRYNAASIDLNRSFSGSYELPFGNGKRFLKDAGRIVNQAVSGWQFNIINNQRSGFPFTPALGFNWSRDGNTSTPDRVSFAPGRTLHGIYLRKPEQ